MLLRMKLLVRGKLNRNVMGVSATMTWLTRVKEKGRPKRRARCSGGGSGLRRCPVLGGRWLRWLWG